MKNQYLQMLCNTGDLETMFEILILEAMFEIQKLNDCLQYED